jgi:hypothetical protein
MPMLPYRPMIKSMTTLPTTSLVSTGGKLARTERGENKHVPPLYNFDFIDAKIGREGHWQNRVLRNDLD